MSAILAAGDLDVAVRCPAQVAQALMATAGTLSIRRSHDLNITGTDTTATDFVGSAAAVRAGSVLIAGSVL